MHRYTSQTGAALIMLLGMMAALAVLAAMLVMVVVNQQYATANVRKNTQSLYINEAGLDFGVRVAELSTPMPGPTSSPSPTPGTVWINQATLTTAFLNYFPHDANTTATVIAYDDLTPVDKNVQWDSNGNSRMWVQADATSHLKKTRSRVLVQQASVPFAAALPKAVTYSDTGIKLNDTSDIYAVDASGNPIHDGSQPTAISAGGTWTTSTSSSWAEVGRLTLNSSANLAGPGYSTQSLGIKANGSVSVGGTVYNSAPNHKIPDTSSPKFTGVTIGAGTVGYLSDYFDQAAQASLTDEAQEGGTPATAPTAPASWTSFGTSITSTLLSTITGASYTATGDLYLPSTVNSGNMTISTSSARTYSFQNLYVAGNLSISGPVTFNATGKVYVGGTLTITGSTSATVTDAITGALYVNGTGASTVKDRVNLSAASLYCGGSLAFNNTTTTTGLTDAIPQIYCVGAFSASGPLTLNATTSLYGGGDVTLNGPSSGTNTDSFGLIYTSNTTKTLAFTGNINVQATGVTANGDFTISGATSTSPAIKDWLGAVYVAAFSSSSAPSTNHGDVNWSGTASVTSRDYTQQTDSTADVAQPKPMWLGRYWSRTGDYDDEYGNIWVPGNSSWSIVLNSTSASTIMCPLLATTEHPQVLGNITFGSRAKPMVFFYICDNNGIYPQVVVWENKGTYYGLMVINESTIDFSGDTDATTPTVEGAVFAGCPYDPTHTSGMSMSDIVLNDSDTIAFNQSVVGAISTSSLHTKTMVTQTVPGSWQQLSAN